MTRATRSNKVFSPWEFCNVSIANPRFNFDKLLRAKVREQKKQTPDSIEEDVDSGADEDATVDDDDDDDELSEGPEHTESASSDNDSDDDFFKGLDDADNAWENATEGPSCGPKGPPSPLQPDSLDSLPSLTPLQPPEPSSASKRKQKRNAASHRARSKKRALPDLENFQPRKSIRLRYNGEGPRVVAVPCPLTLNDKNVTSTAYVGKRDTDGTRAVRPLDYFVGENSKLGFTLEEWDGRTPKALVDRNNRVIGVLAGHPNAPDWPKLHREGAAAMEACRVRCEGSDHGAGRRGAFSALQCGVSHGGGQKAPGNLHNGATSAEALDELNNMECFTRIASFSNSVLATRAPKLYKYYAKTTAKLLQNNKKLKRPFPKSVFCGCTHNLGPQTCCYKHRDSGNLAFGMCAITPLGDYDPKLGGHLVLWDCHMVIEFPPGSTILIPSAILAHSNTAVQANERRYSFTQYTSGSIFRWVENKCQKATTHFQSLTKEGKKKAMLKDSKRWKYGLSLLPILPRRKV